MTIDYDALATRAHQIARVIAHRGVRLVPAKTH